MQTTEGNQFESLCRLQIYADLCLAANRAPALLLESGSRQTGLILCALIKSPDEGISLKGISSRVDLSYTTVSEAVKPLVGCDLVIREKGAGRIADRYRLNKDTVKSWLSKPLDPAFVKVREQMGFMAVLLLAPKDKLERIYEALEDVA